MRLLVKKTYSAALEQLRLRRQLIVYGFIGVSGATLDILIYLLLYKEFGVYPPLASFLSVTIAITNNFILNAKFNFKVSDNLLKRFYSFYGIGLSGAVLSAIAIAALQAVDVGPTIAKLLTIPPIVVGQYILNKKISFKQAG